MSRVSEAFERASVEGARVIANSSSIQEQNRGEVSSCAEADIENIVPTLDRESPSVASGALPSKASWPIGKRLQHVIFGRGLEKYNELPVVFQEQHSLAAEEYKKLRQQVKQIYHQDSTHLLAVMSPIKGDGKSTVAVNLAAVVALDFEQQVLLIDADLRSPSIHDFFGLSSTPGLADYLSSPAQTDIANYVQNTSFSSLRVLPAGRPTHLSSELLATERMKSLLKDIPSRFPGQYVIVDTSPVLSTSDPLVLAHQVNSIVMVVRAGATPRNCLSEAIKSLGPNRVKGIILNGATVAPSSKYYYYSTAVQK
jgi:capsular exopolysaccharide synthesis family protein